MWAAIATVFLTFLLTGLVGRRLIHRWQHRSWLLQQRLLDAERELNALDQVFNEVASLAGKRQHRMFRLLVSLRGKGANVVRKRLNEYEKATIAWNDQLNAFYAKLAVQLTWSHTEKLEKIQSKFVSIGRRLEDLTEKSLAGDQISIQEIIRVNASLNVLQGEIGNFHKDVLRFIQKRKLSVYAPDELTEATLDSVPTWELFIALFKPWVQRKDVV